MGLPLLFVVDPLHRFLLAELIPPLFPLFHSVKAVLLFGAPLPAVFLPGEGG